jgi:hypothetical protein
MISFDKGNDRERNGFKLRSRGMKELSPKELKRKTLAEFGFQSPCQDARKRNDNVNTYEKEESI